MKRKHPMYQQHDSNQPIISSQSSFVDIHQQKPILRRPNSNYKSYKYNRVNGIIEMSSSEAKETYGDGTCFFIVSNAPKKTTVVANYIENEARHSVITAIHDVQTSQADPIPPIYTMPYHDYNRYGNSMSSQIHISTKEYSISSGVGSGDSSELDSPIPPVTMITNTNATSNHVSNECLLTERKHRSHICTVSENYQNNLGFRSCSTQTDHSVSCPCHNISGRQTRSKIRVSLNSSTDSSRRDSGFSSISSTSYYTNGLSSSPLRCIGETEVFNTSSPCSHLNSYGHTNFIKIYEKEELLARIKKNLYDPKKELFLRQIKQLLLKSGQKSFKSECDTNISWNPIKLHNNSHPLRGVLKNQRNHLLEEIQMRHNMKALERAHKEKSLLCPLKRSEVIEIIKQVRQCLEITQQQSVRETSPLECKFQVHRKIKLKSFSLNAPKHNKELNNTTNNPKQQLDENYDSKKFQEAAGKGDVKNILKVLNSDPSAINDTEVTGWPAFHHAFTKKHYRTAILLLEGGTNLEEYTQQRVNEYYEMMDVINRNKRMISN